MNTGELVEIVLDIDLNKEPECESPFHGAGGFWGRIHTHGDTATHVVRGPCPHVQGLRCQAWVAMVSVNGCFCTGCGDRVEPSELIFIEL